MTAPIVSHGSRIPLPLDIIYYQSSFDADAYTTGTAGSGIRFEGQLWQRARV